MQSEKTVAALTYPVVVEPLSAEDGGGFLASVPDLPGCMSDGETPEEALRSVQEAIAEWIEEARRLGREVPKPSRKAA
jgi:antitoxin HicB